MTKASDNVFPRFLISEGGSTATPASGRVTMYAKADGLLYSKDDAGAETALGGGSGIPATILDAKGDIIAASAADTAARLAVGTNGLVLVARSAETTGLKWEPAPGTMIALKAYGTSGSYATTTTFADMDATNLAVAFTVPPSGNVLIQVQCQAFNSTTSGVLYWGLRESSSTVAGPSAVASPEGETAGNTRTITKDFYFTGLTPGDAKTYKWAAKHTGNSWTNRWDSAADSHGFATMKVFFAP